MAPRAHTRKPQPAKLAHLIEEMMSHIHRRSADDTLAVMNEAGLTMAQMVALHLLTHLGPGVGVVDRRLPEAVAARDQPPRRPHGRRGAGRAHRGPGRSPAQAHRDHADRARPDRGDATSGARASSPACSSQPHAARCRPSSARCSARVVTELKGLPDRDEVREIVGKELQKREAQAADSQTQQSEPEVVSMKAIVSVKDAVKNYTLGNVVVPALRGVTLDVVDGRLHLHRRPVGQRQDDAAQPDRLRRHADVGDRGGGGQGHAPALRARADRRCACTPSASSSRASTWCRC